MSENKHLINNSLIEIAEHGVSFVPFALLGYVSSLVYRVDNSLTKSFLKTALFYSAISAVSKVATSVLASNSKSLLANMADTASSGLLITSGVINNLGALNVLKEFSIMKPVLGLAPVLKALALTNAISITVEMDKLGKYIAGDWSSFGEPIVLKQTIAQFGAQIFKYSGLDLLKSSLKIGEESLFLDQGLAYGASMLILGGATYNIKKLTQDGLEYALGNNVTLSADKYAENFVSGAVNYGLYQWFDRQAVFTKSEHEVARFENFYKSDEVFAECIAGVTFENAELLCQEAGLCSSIANLITNVTYFG